MIKGLSVTGLRRKSSNAKQNSRNFFLNAKIGGASLALPKKGSVIAADARKAVTKSLHRHQKSSHHQRALRTKLRKTWRKPSRQWANQTLIPKNLNLPKLPKSRLRLSQPSRVSRNRPKKSKTRQRSQKQPQQRARRAARPRLRRKWPRSSRIRTERCVISSGRLTRGSKIPKRRHLKLLSRH